MARRISGERGAHDTALEWRRHVEDQAASGLSQEEFCRVSRLSLSRFRYWKYKRLPQRTARDGEEMLPAFLPVDVPVGLAPCCGEQVDRDDAGVEILVGAVAVRVTRGFDASALARVLSVLEARRC
jgi:hypothetical protein